MNPPPVFHPVSPPKSIAEFLAFPIAHIFGFVRNAKEASTLVEIGATASLIESTTTLLRTNSFQEQAISDALRSFANPSNEVLNTSNCALTGLSQRHSEIKDRLGSHLRDACLRLCQNKLQLERFVELHEQIASELEAEGCEPLANQKRKLATCHRILCSRIQWVTSGCPLVCPFPVDQRSWPEILGPLLPATPTSPPASTAGGRGRQESVLGTAAGSEQRQSVTELDASAVVVTPLRNSGPQNGPSSAGALKRKAPAGSGVARNSPRTPLNTHVESSSDELDPGESDSTQQSEHFGQRPQPPAAKRAKSTAAHPSPAPALPAAPKQKATPTHQPPPSPAPAPTNQQALQKPNAKGQQQQGSNQKFRTASTGGGSVEHSVATPSTTTSKHASMTSPVGTTPATTLSKRADVGSILTKTSQLPNITTPISVSRANSDALQSKTPQQQQQHVGMVLKLESDDGSQLSEERDDEEETRASEVEEEGDGTMGGASGTSGHGHEEQQHADENSQHEEGERQEEGEEQSGSQQMLEEENENAEEGFGDQEVETDLGEDQNLEGSNACDVDHPMGTSEGSTVRQAVEVEVEEHDGLQEEQPKPITGLISAEHIAPTGSTPTTIHSATPPASNPFSLFNLSQDVMGEVDTQGGAFLGSDTLDEESLVSDSLLESKNQKQNENEFSPTLDDHDMDLFSPSLPSLDHGQLFPPINSNLTTPPVETGPLPPQPVHHPTHESPTPMDGDQEEEGMQPPQQTQGLNSFFDLNEIEMTQAPAKAKRLSSESTSSEGKISPPPPPPAPTSAPLAAGALSFGTLNPFLSEKSGPSVPPQALGAIALTKNPFSLSSSVTRKKFITTSADTDHSGEGDKKPSVQFAEGTHTNSSAKPTFGSFVPDTLDADGEF